MGMQTSNYDLLIQKLDQFIRKFYLNKLIKGGLYFLAVSLGLFLLFNFLEHQFYFSQGVRKTFFFGFLATSGFGLIFWVFNPLFKYLKLGKNISHDKAAQVIGNHFTDVQDKLLNVLQLKRQNNSDSFQADLIQASINQKSAEISPVPFKSAIDLSKNRKYLKYALPPFLLLIFVLFAAPSIITDSTHRIINNGKEFERKALFSFDLNQEKMEVVQFEDYVLDISTSGEVLPDEVFIQFDDFQYKLQKNGPNKHSYVFRNVQKNTNFRIFSGTVSSGDKVLEVIKKPNLANFNLRIFYPKYLNKKSETVSNVGDVVIPEGSRLRWNFIADNTDELSISFNDKKPVAVERKSENEFSFGRSFRNDTRYKLKTANSRIPNGDSLLYSIDVIQDEYPSIVAENFIDSLDSKLIYFVGNANDDYGILSVNFVYSLTDQKGTIKQQQTQKLVGSSGRATDFDHIFDINTLDLQPGDKLNYYFETFDNDGVNGSKSSKTNLMTFEKPSIEEFEKMEDDNEEDIKKTIESSLENIKKLQEEYKKLREKLLQEKDISWQDKKELEELMEKQKELQEDLKKAKEKFEENLKNQEEFNEQKEEIQEKQEKLQQLFEEALDPETQELMEKINELMEELNKDEAMDMMEQMEMDDNSVEKELDRLLELFKQLEMEKEIKETIEKLEELAKEQEELAKETKEEEKSNEELKKEQEKINEDFEKLKEKMEELEEKNKELSPPKDLGDKEENEEKMEEIQDELDDSKESLEKKDSKGASESQKKASEKMKKMAGGLQQEMESGEQEQMEEDMQALRQLLENLLDLSFDEEQLTKDLNSTRVNSPVYKDYVQTQFRLNDDFSLIQDSLHALSKRVSQIESIVTEKTQEISTDLDSSLVFLEDRKMTKFQELKSIQYQRRIMKNVNDLALMLNEAMQQMQEQMAGMMPGSQMCKKPGNKPGGKPGKVPGDKITEGQGKLNDQMKKMKEGMKGGGKGGNAKQFAEAAAKQAALRKALEDLNNEKKEQGKGSQELQEIIDQMNKVETDLVNKKFDNQVFKRQQDILTKLLKADKAERQREYDNKRKAETGVDKKRELPPSVQQYLKERKADVELFKTMSPDLRPFYKGLVDKYYNSFKKETSN